MMLKKIVGRALFLSFFLFSAWNEYRDISTDGGPAVGRYIRQRLEASPFIRKIDMEDFDIEVAARFPIVLKLVGSFYFMTFDLIPGANMGAIVLAIHQVVTTPLLYDFYNYEADTKEFAELSLRFTMNLTLLGALLVIMAHNRMSSRKKVEVIKAFYRYISPTKFGLVRKSCHGTKKCILKTNEGKVL